MLLEQGFSHARFNKKDLDPCDQELVGFFKSTWGKSHINLKKILNVSKDTALNYLGFLLYLYTCILFCFLRLVP